MVAHPIDKTDFFPRTVRSRAFLIFSFQPGVRPRKTQLYIKDTSSSSGMFLNHMRLFYSGIESRAFYGDILLLGVGYQGSTKGRHRCVGLGVENGRPIPVQPSGPTLQLGAPCARQTNLAAFDAD